MIGIIGYGFVGRAVASVLTGEYCVVDPAHANSVTLNEMRAKEPTAIFICVPTLQDHTGKCDDSIVMQYVSSLVDYQGLLVIKSTVPPSTVEKILAARHETVIWPELLREKTAVIDIRSPSVVVLGAESDLGWTAAHKFILERTNIVVTDERIVYVSPVEASMFKYTLNSFLAVKVAFMHEMYSWLYSRGEETSWDTIAGLLAMEGRIGASHMKVPGEHGLGFGGHCLPKDLNALIHQTSSDGFFSTMLEATNVTNERLKKRNK